MTFFFLGGVLGGGWGMAGSRAIRLMKLPASSSGSRLQLHLLDLSFVLSAAPQAQVLFADHGLTLLFG